MRLRPSPNRPIRTAEGEGKGQGAAIAQEGRRRGETEGDAPDDKPKFMGGAEHRTSRR